MFVFALCKVQTVGFEKLANAFDSNAMASSSLRRIQRFIARYCLDSDLIAKLIFGLLPQKKDLKLSIDRTNWKFGQTNINIFMLGVTYKGVAFPLLFKMLDKRGNSNCGERIALVERFIKLFGTTFRFVQFPPRFHVFNSMIKTIQVLRMCLFLFRIQAKL